MRNFIKLFVRDESAASAAEYALILVIVGIAIVVGALLAMVALMGGSMMGFAAGGSIDAAAPAMGATMIVFVLGFLVLMVLLALLSAAFMAVLHASLAGPEAVAETFA